MNMKKIYTRAIIDQNEQDESRMITGKAISFGTPSNYIGYIEYINRDAITQELIDESDIIMNYNHNDADILARWSRGEGTLNIELREDGVYFSFECPETTLGNDILWHIRHGNLSQCSFAFTVSGEDAFRWFENENKELCAEIMRIDGLYDLSIVTTPAYDDTFVGCRNFNLSEIKRGLDDTLETSKEEQRENTSPEQEVSILSILDEKRKNILNYI